MAVVIDAGAQAVFLGVRDLAEEPGFARIGFDREGWTTFALGTEVHERVLAGRVAADPAYRKEIHVSAIITVEDWTATITGRIDGARADDADGWHLEEFKTASLAGGGPKRTGAGFERHRRQLLLYAELWTRLGHRVDSARLVYVDPASGREEPIPVAFDPAIQEAETLARLRRLLGLWREAEETRRRKAAFAEVLPFPHAEPRPGQRLLSAAVRDSLETGGHLLAEAPTGSGKTAAALHPALAHTLRTGRRLAFLTSKTLQQQMALRALAAMNTDGVFRAVQLRAKERMCANDRVLCHEDACPYARHYPAKMERSKLLDRLLEHGTHHLPDKVFAAAKAEEVCPFEVQLELARHADAVVADYNHVFDPGAALTQFRDDGLKETVLVIDEAHNLPDRVRGIFSPELLETEILAALAAARALTKDAGGSTAFGRRRKIPRDGQLELGARLGSSDDARPPDLSPPLIALRDLLIARAAAHLPPDGKDAAAELPPPEAAVTAIWSDWEPRFLAHIAWKQQRRLPPGEDPVVEVHFALLRFVAVLRMARRPGENAGLASAFTTVIERKSGSLRLALLCLDPAAPAAPIFHRTASAVCLSATLRPFALFRRSLGLDVDRTADLVVPSPFPPENRRVLVVPTVRTTYAAREKALPKIAALIAEIDAAHGGNKLALFPSYDLLRRVADLLPPELVTGGRLLRQSAHAAEAERHALLAALARPPRGGHLLLAVLGGMFAEGVDYPGALLETVVVVSPGLPQVGFERELLRRHHEERDGNGFEQAYLQPGMTRVIQAAGRLIRTETDRGVIVLVCQRFLEEGYVERLPRDWYRRSPTELLSVNPAADIRAFFGKKAIQPARET